MAPGKPLTGLDESDPASWVMGPNAVRQGPAGGGMNFPGGAALRMAAGSAMASAGLPSPQEGAVRAARQVSGRLAGAPTPLHLEAPTFPGLGGGASTSASIARAANGVVGEGNGTGMIVRDLKALGGKLAWHGTPGSAEGLRGAADRQAQGFNSSSVGGFFTNGGFSPVHGSGAAESGTGIGHEGSQGGGSASSGAPAADSKNTTSKDPAAPSSSSNDQQPQMPSGGAPGGGQDDKKKEQQQAQQGAQVCQLLGNSGLTHASAGPGMSSAIPTDTGNAQQLCTKNLQSLKNQAALHKWAKKPYQECQAYCSKAAMGLGQ